MRAPDPSHSTDNPPPKVVQGYKFNIFYPDLIDKSKAPTYKIVKEPGNDDTVLLHFSAGPPYEDIAFRIVNREWEFSHKRYVDPLTESPAVPLIIHLYSGFRSSFDRGCLSLWFNFRRNVSVFWTYVMYEFLTSSRSSTGNNHALSSGDSGDRGIL